MLPFLGLLKDGAEHLVVEAVIALSNESGLSSEEREQHLSSGPQTVIRNRTGWACTYLKKAGLIESPRRGVFRITDRSQSVLASAPERIDVKYLEQFPEFVAFREIGRERSEVKPGVLDPVLDATPGEALDSAYRVLRGGLELELLEQVKAASPAFFERLVVELLVGVGRAEEEGRQVAQGQDRPVLDQRSRRLQLEVQVRQEGRLPLASHDGQDGHTRGRHDEVAEVHGEVTG